jgi:hypothetical protein
MHRKLLLIAFIFIQAQWANAQNRTIVTGTFSGKFDAVIQQLESQTDFHFYYDHRWTDSLTISFEANQEKIDQVMTKLLNGTDLRATVDKNLNVFITLGRDLMTQLPEGYFPDKGKTEQRVAYFDYSEYERREKKKKTAEEKVYYIGVDNGNLQGSAVIAGHVKDAENGEPIVGASVYIDKPLIGVTTDQFGYYSITIPKGRNTLQIKSIGMKPTKRQVMLYSSGKLNIDLDEEITPLKEVVVTSDRDARVAGMKMGTDKLDIRTMKQMPLALGETDIMKVILTLPGVQSVGEGTVGLNVRGGATNQNLILYNDATVYNPSHLFGFFSTFNPDVLKNVELYKSGITADYGGRLSSVLDVHTREGNAKKISGSGGISPITGRLTIEGPLVKEKTSFLVGVRSTYSNWILRKVDNDQINRSSASFYDINLAITHKISDADNIYLSGYYSKDKFSFATDTLYSYSDRNLSLKWKHIFNNKFYGVFTAGTSQYKYSLDGEEEVPSNTFTMDFSVAQYNLKGDFNYFLNEKHTLTAGISTIRYVLNPGRFLPKGSASDVNPDIMQKEQGMESAVYVGENFDVSPNLSLYGGVRYSFYQALGPKNVLIYGPDAPREEGSIIDSVNHGGGSIASYQGLEPRFSLRYLVGKDASLKVSYNRMRQYIQMLSNTTAITPTDIWKLSDSYIRPQIGDQYSIGFYKNFKNGLIETSIEAYYKDIKSTIDYKDGAELLLNPNLEQDVVEAQGRAYGIEFLVKKTSGKVNGWITYTYSRSFLKMNGKYKSEIVNQGEYYPTSYDKPHAVNFIGNYKFSRRFNFSLNFVYSTGRPITVPILKYEIGGAERVYYSDRNRERIDDYIRTDISINVEGNHKIKKLAHSSWTFAVYNLFGRNNPYSVFFTSENGVIKGYKLSIFAQPIPTITYNFKF